ncbi:Tripartite-type tricarboxylate transporter, receptor component TctC [Sphaerotilus natans]|jgi:tripartite-type tricarboxylate transporter receptor subunit TctC|nr:tripartite tricarboxylate transporter substrate binding protein [Sphaerotilus natans]SIR23548.1 Tripartite-type tricarboxylate transporter, receptor component TctC [Sphaerotilus natans]
MRPPHRHKPLSWARRSLAASLLLAIGTSGALAQAPAADYPNKPVKIVVPFSPGGPNDVMARVLAARLSANLGQQFIVENKAGAGGTIGTDAVAKAPADGYTLLFPSAPFVTAPALYGKKLGYDTLQDLTGITKVAESPMVLMVAASSPYRTLKELLAAASTQPGKLLFASGGVASTPHLATSLLESITQTDMLHIPYKGGGPAMMALIGGEVTLFLDSIISGGQHLQAGKVRALAVTGAQRLPRLPQVPTFAEAGLPGYQMTHWVGLAAPAKTPQAILDKLNREAVKALAADDVKARLAELGVTPVGSTREAFNQFIAQEVPRWTDVVRTRRIEAE